MHGLSRAREGTIETFTEAGLSARCEQHGVVGHFKVIITAEEPGCLNGSCFDILIRKIQAWEKARLRRSTAPEFDV